MHLLPTRSGGGLVVIVLWLLGDGTLLGAAPQALSYYGNDGQTAS